MNKKNVKIILQVVFLVIIFVFLAAFMELDANINYFETNYNNGDQKVSYVIESKEELEQYVSNEEMLSKYEEEYFDEKQLVLIVLPLEAYNIKANVTDYKITDGVMEVTILKDYPEYCLWTMKTLNILIEVDNVEINEVNIIINEK